MFRPVSILIFMATLSSCDLSRHEADEPYYLTLQEATLLTNNEQGVNSHRITEGWIYADSQLIGAYHLPAQLPVLGESPITLNIFAGIRENGIAEAPRIYPFYTVFEYVWDTEMIPDLSVEQSLFTADIDGDPATGINRVNDSETGSRVGKAELTDLARELDVATSFVYDQFPRDGRPVYLEMEYKSDIPLFIGLRHVNPGIEPVSNFKLVLFPNEMWEKIYVNFTPELRNADFDGFQVELFAQYQEEKEAEIQNLYIDNLKLVHQR
jgi:hypothetical protein